MRFVKISSASLLAILFLLVLNHCAPAVPDALAPDLVLHNGKIVTVDEDFSIAQAVAIRDGRFVAVGSDSEILSLAGSNTRQVDLEGNTVLPGFNDSHLHLAWSRGRASRSCHPAAGKSAIDCGDRGSGAPEGVGYTSGRTCLDAGRGGPGRAD